MTNLATACFIKEIGRGKNSARSLSRKDAKLLYSAMLDNKVSDLELGAILLAMRIKGESIEEVSGFLEAVEDTLELLKPPLGKYAPIIIPTYNGSRRIPNLTPLLALLLARAGAPVLIHGLTYDLKRVTTAEILEILDIKCATNLREVQVALNHSILIFVPTTILAPKLSHLLMTRKVLGVRNSVHMLVKIIQPFSGPALLLTSYTHPEYFNILSQYFSNLCSYNRGDVFLMRGTEGETVVNIKSKQKINWFHNGQCTVLTEKQNIDKNFLNLPKECGAEITANWINTVLDGRIPIPNAIAEQVQHCLTVAALINTRK